MIRLLERYLDRRPGPLQLNLLLRTLHLQLSHRNLRSNLSVVSLVSWHPTSQSFFECVLIVPTISQFLPHERSHKASSPELVALSS